MPVLRRVFLIAVCLAVGAVSVSSAQNAKNTDWFKDAGYGVFMHFLPGDAKGLTLVNQFDVEALARQLETLGAKYFVLTLGQNSGFFNSPNATYDRLTGYAPGERCSPRDLPLDLYRALQPKGIRLMLYLPCQTPNQDARAQKTFGLPEGKKDQPIDLEFARKWAQVIQEWSDRYGDKVAGWWFDGGYDHIKFNEAIAQIYARAVKHGNPNAIVTFNPGVKLIRHTQAEDYTAGELNEPFNVLPTSRWVNGSQWHALTYLGSHWSGRDTRHPTERWAQWVSAAISKGGVVTLDMGPNWDPQAGPIGSLAEGQMAQVRAIHTALERANPSRPAVELRARNGLPNFFAKAKAGGEADRSLFRRQHHGRQRLAAADNRLAATALSQGDLHRNRCGHRRHRLGPRCLPARARRAGLSSGSGVRRVRRQRRRRSTGADLRLHGGHRPTDSPGRSDDRHLLRLHDA